MAHHVVSGFEIGLPDRAHVGSSERKAACRERAMDCSANNCRADIVGRALLRDPGAVATGVVRFIVRCNRYWIFRRAILQETRNTLGRSESPLPLYRMTAVVRWLLLLWGTK